MKKYWRDTKHHRNNGMDADIIRGISLGMDASCGLWEKNSASSQRWKEVT